MNILLPYLWSNFEYFSMNHGFSAILITKIGGPMKYSLEIESDLLAELQDIARKMHTDTDTVICACLKAHIIAEDVYYGNITKRTEREA